MGIESDDPDEFVVDALIGTGGPLAPGGTPPELPAVPRTITAAAAAARHTNHFLMDP
jgi:hypothetical protein